MANALEQKLDTRLASLENGQNLSRSAIETQVESQMKRYQDQLALFEKKLHNVIDDKIFDQKKQW